MSFGVPLPESESEFPSYPHYPQTPSHTSPHDVTFNNAWNHPILARSRSQDTASDSTSHAALDSTFHAAWDRVSTFPDPPPTPRAGAKGASGVDSKGAWGVESLLLGSGGACEIRRCATL